MKKSKLIENVASNMSDAKTALQTLWDNINKGQRKQLIKIAEIKAVLDRYGVEYEE